MKAIGLFLVFGISLSACSQTKRDKVTSINGKPIICTHEAYNCPSYKGPYQNKRLKSCEDVKAVWDTCNGDPHDLDRDNDGKPCERDCPRL